MSVIKLVIYIFTLSALSSCGALHKVQMFFAACTGEREINCLDWAKDVYRFKSKLKKLDNYDELASHEGVDKNGNKLRDDVEMFIDFYYKEKLGYPENYLNALRQYATMIDTYSRLAPSKELIRAFAKDNQETLNCSFRLDTYYKIFGPKGILHRNQIRYWILRSAQQKVRLDRGFIYPSEGIMPNLHYAASYVFLKKSCHFPLVNYDRIFQSAISHNGELNINTIRLDLKRFEKVFGTQYRDIYEHLLK